MKSSAKASGTWLQVITTNLSTHLASNSTTKVPFTSRVAGFASSVMTALFPSNTATDVQSTLPAKKAVKQDESLNSPRGDPESLERTTLLRSTADDDDDDEKKLQKEPERDTSRDFSWSNVGKQAKLFQQMAGPYYKESKTGRWLLIGLLALTLVNSGVSVAFSYLSKDFWNALSEKNVDEFYFVLQKFSAALLVGAPVITVYRYQREQLAVHWREWMTARTFQLYTTNRVYYNLERGSAIDNPDQRIAEDVNTFTGFSLQLVITLLTSLIDLASFSTILWSIYPQLFGAIILYAAVGTFFTAYFGKSLVGLNFAQLQREADLRYSLVRLRDNSESIAFYAGEDLEGQAVEDRLEAVMETQRAINAAQRNVELFTNSYRYLVQVFPVAVVAPKYFAGEIGLGVISQSVGAFNHILNDLSVIVNQFERLSSFSAGIDRLSSFFEAMRDVDIERDVSSPLLGPTNVTEDFNATIIDMEEAEAVDGRVNGYGTITLSHFANGHYQNNVILSIDHLDLCTPDQKRLLVSDLNLQLKEGEDLLIVGNSGAGKSSLLRAIAGLWTVGNGAIERPVDEEVYFLPQRPYCTLGSLKDQLLYPSLDQQVGDENNNGQKIVPRSHWLKQSITDDDLLEVLEKVDLMGVATRAGDGDPRRGLHAVLDWSNRLSLGEQQRLAFGRLLVNRPRLVILDEATSALDMVAEARMYTLLRDMSKRNLSTKGGLSAPGLTYISVGHRPSLLSYHDKRLRLSGEEGFELTDIEKSSLQIPAETANL